MKSTVRSEFRSVLRWFEIWFCGLNKARLLSLLNMRIIRVRSSYFVGFILCLVCTSISSAALPRPMKTSRKRQTQEKGDFTLKSKNNATTRLDKSLSDKEDSAPSEAPSLVQNPDARQKVNGCQLSNETLDRIPKRSGSDWIVDDAVVNLLQHDLQELILCTRPHERVIFQLQDPVHLSKTIRISHELEFIAKAFKINKGEKNEAPFASFLCHESGAALVVSTRSFNATGLSIESCNNASSKASVIIRSRSNAVFTRTTFKNNKNRAVYIDREGDATFVECNFDGNEDENNGGAIHSEGDSHIKVLNSKFNGNKAYKGGAIFIRGYSVLELHNSTLSNNRAHSGGALCLARFDSFSTHGFMPSNLRTNFERSTFLRDNDTSTITNSTISKNSAVHGGGLYLEHYVSLNIFSSKLSENNAKETGGAIFLDMIYTLTMTDSRLTNNEATYHGGALYSISSRVYLTSISMKSNKGIRGGAIYMRGSGELEAVTSIFEKNRARSFGGALYLLSSNAEVKTSSFRENKAWKSGGALYSLNASHIIANEVSLVSNIASQEGGGVTLVNGSSLLCSSCTIKKNSAFSGGGVYVSSNNSISIVAQLESSSIEKNIAKSHGGGIAIDHVKNRGANCSNPRVKCASIVLLGTSFTNNHASSVGVAIFTSNPNMVFYQCEERQSEQGEFLEQKDLRLLSLVRPDQKCATWTGNTIGDGDHESVIGTYGQKLFLYISKSEKDYTLVGSYENGFELKGVASGEELPVIYINALDYYGEGPAATIPNAFRAQLSSSSTFLRGLYPTQVINGFGSFSEIVGFGKPGNYTLEVIPENGRLDKVNLIVFVRECNINEESSRGQLLCQQCSSVQYNFHPSKLGGCQRCPNDATCEGKYIIPNEGYWNKGPCHDTVKKCVVEEACNAETRADDLRDFTQPFKDCELNEAMLEAYNAKLCHDGYKGPLCGSCKESYGISLTRECVKCGTMALPAFASFGIMFYLLVGTALSLRATLPISSRRRRHWFHHESTRPLIQNNDSSLLDDGAIDQTTITSQNGNGVPSQPTADEEDIESSTSSEETPDTKMARRRVIETWKILLNYFQVTSHAATMNVQWTKGIMRLLETLQVVGSATINSVSRPIGCLFTSTSNATRAITRLLFSLFVPIVVIAILSFYWVRASTGMQRREKVRYLVKRFLLTVLTVTYIIYFDLTQVAVNTFNCVVVDDSPDPFSNSTARYWIGDTSIECYKSAHSMLIGVAVAILAFVSFAFPLFCSLALVRQRDEVMQSNSWAHETLGLLCGPFKAKFVYWECVTMIKKALLSIVLVFSYSLGNQAQGLLLTLVLMVFFCVHSVCYPFEERFNQLNYYEIGSLLTSCATYTLVQFFNVGTCSRTARDFVSIVLILLNGGFIGVMVLHIGRNIIQLLKASLESENIEVSNDMDWFSVVKLYYDTWRRHCRNS